MQNIIAASSSGDELWRAVAARALDDAHESMNATATALQRLVAENTWSSKGVRTLIARLGELHEQASRETWEVESLRRDVTGVLRR